MTGSEWYIPAGVPEGQKTWPEKSHIALTDYQYWLLQLQPVWVESNIEILSMLILRFFFFFNVIHHDYKAVRRLLLLLIVCLSSLKCDSGVMDNCTAILTTVSSILSFSSFNNVHYYCSHKRAPTNACPCRNHIRGGQCCPRSQPLTDRYGEGISAWPSVHCVAHRWLFFAPHQPRGPRENIKRWQSHRSGGGTWNDYLCIIRPQIWFCAYTFDPNAKPPFSFLNNHKQFLSFRCSVFVRTGCFRWY